MLAGLDVAARDVPAARRRRSPSRAGRLDGDAARPGDEIADRDRLRARAARRASAPRSISCSGCPASPRGRAQFVDAAGGRITVLDTRKTTPTLRVLEKYAVAAGGGDEPPRRPLRRDPIKDNHVRLAGGVDAAVARARDRSPGLRGRGRGAEARPRSTRRSRRGADIILADNMSIADIRETVARARRAARRSRSPAASRSIACRSWPHRRRLRVGRRADALGARRRHQLRDRADLTWRLPPDARLEAFERARGRARAAWRPRAVFHDDRLDQRRRRVAGCRAGVVGAVVIADAQTAGRGRRGRTWFSPPGSGLYVSVVSRRRARASDPDARDDAADARRGRRARRRRRARDRPVAPTSSGRTTCSSAGASSPASSPKACGDGVASCSATASTSVRWRIPPELRDRATSLETELGRADRSRRGGRRDARRARVALRRPASPAGSMLFSTRGARRAPGAVAARASSWDDARRAAVGHHRRHRRSRRACSCRVGGPRRADRRGRSGMTAASDPEADVHAARHRRRQHQHRPRRVRRRRAGPQLAAADAARADVRRARPARRRAVRAQRHRARRSVTRRRSSARSCRR